MTAADWIDNVHEHDWNTMGRLEQPARAAVLDGWDPSWKAKAAIGGS
jgi:hypothetical protein